MNIQKPTGREEQVGKKPYGLSQLPISSPALVTPLAVTAERLLNS